MKKRGRSIEMATHLIDKYRGEIDRLKRLNSQIISEAHKLASSVTSVDANPNDEYARRLLLDRCAAVKQLTTPRIGKILHTKSKAT